jgi:branched-chain amino acid transport system substrate-binding protein
VIGIGRGAALLPFAVALLVLAAACGGAAPAPSSQPGQVRAISATSTPAASAGSPSAAVSPTAAPTLEPSAADTVASAEPIKVGLIGPISGAAAAFGQDMLKGAQMALDEANAAGNLNGKKLTLDQGDDKADPATAGDVAKKLVGDGVVAVIGPATSPAALAVESVFNDAKVPMLTPSANDPRITDQNLKFVFRLAGRWDQEPPLLVDALTKQTPNAKIALVAGKSAYGQALAGALRQSLATAGQQPVADESIDAGTKDFAPLASKLKPLAPSAVFYAGYAADGGALVKALRAGGLQTTFAMGDAGQDQALIGQAGQAAEGMLLAYPPDPKQVASAGAFLDAFKRRYGTTASRYAVSSYDTARLLAEAIRRTNGGSEHDALQSAISSASGVSGVYWGKMSFDAKGDLQAKTYVLWTVHGGKFEQASS